jgi:hypothetical protein
MQALSGATLKKIWPRRGQAADTRSAVTTTFNVSRTVRRKDGTPGGGCARHTTGTVDMDAGVRKGLTLATSSG